MGKPPRPSPYGSSATTCLVPSSYPDSPRTRLIETVRNILQQCWGLRVLCECSSPTSDACTYVCHGTSVHAVGHCLVRGSAGEGSAYTHPNALDSSWSIKLGSPLISPVLSYPSYLPCFLTGVLSNSRCYRCRCDTWAGELVTVAPWMQVALVLGYTRRAVLRATHSAVVRGLSTGPQDCNETVKFLYQIGPHLPMPRPCAIATALKWMRRHAKWRGHEYSSRSLPHHLHPGNTSGAWCSDYTSQSFLLPTPPYMRVEQGLMSSGCSGHVRAAA